MAWILETRLRCLLYFVSVDFFTEYEISDDAKAQSVLTTDFRPECPAETIADICESLEIPSLFYDPSYRSLAEQAVNASKMSEGEEKLLSIALPSDGTIQNFLRHDADNPPSPTYP